MFVSKSEGRSTISVKRAKRTQGLWALTAMTLAAGAVLISGASPVSTAKGQSPVPIALAGGGAIPRAHEVADDDASTLELTGLQDRFEEVSRKVAPSVVAISVAVESRGDEDTIRPDDLSGRKLTGILERTTRTVGTGMVISADGLILTNEHVVSEAEQLWCTTDDGRVLPAFVVGSDPRQDLAVLRIPATNLKPVTFANPATVKRGAWAIALGNPYGLANEGHLAMAVGVVSATGRSLPRLSARENRLYSDLIQTTAEINPGNSGGPLFDVAGNVIGINTAVVLPQKNTNGIGFALPVSTGIRARVEELKQGSEIAYGELGITVSQPTARQRRAAGVTADTGVRVEGIENAGPCTGVLKEGDVLLAVNGTPLTDLDRFNLTATTIRSGPTTVLTVCRSGKTSEVEVNARRKPSPATPIYQANQRYRWNGLLLGPIPAHWDFGSKPKPTQGIMVLAMDAGLRTTLTPGTVITALGDHAITSIADFQLALASLPPESAALTLWPETAPVVESQKAAAQPRLSAGK